MVNMATRQKARTTTLSKRKDTYHHGDLKRALIAAALELVTEQGPMGFTLSEAARRAGVSNAAPYRHFASREDLVATVAQQGFEELYDALVAVEATPDPVAHVVAMSDAYVRWAAAHSAHYQVMFGPEARRLGSGDWMTAEQRAFGVLVEAIKEGQGAGMIQSGDPLSVAGRAWALVHGVASLHVSGDFNALGIVEAVDHLATRAVAALLASPDVRRETVRRLPKRAPATQARR
jgi:AcrR family transcriptional regulator